MQINFIILSRFSENTLDGLVLLMMADRRLSRRKCELTSTRIIYVGGPR